MKHDCPFCKLTNVEYTNEWFNVIYDKYPVSEGHMLIISKRHVETYFDLIGAEKNELIKLIDKCKEYLDFKFKPDGYNIGCNCGECAGQTVKHFHLHIIPRYNDDMDNPQGGVRGVIPDKQKY